MLRDIVRNVILASLALTVPALAPTSAPVRVETVARGLEHPGVWRSCLTGACWSRSARGGSDHWGSRLVFRRDGTLFVALGDRFGRQASSQQRGK